MSDEKKSPHTLEDWEQPKDNQDGDMILPEEVEHDVPEVQITEENVEYIDPDALFPEPAGKYISGHRKEQVEARKAEDHFEPLTDEEMDEARAKLPGVFSPKSRIGNLQTFDYPPDNPDTEMWIPTADEKPEDELTEYEKRFRAKQEQFRKDFKEACADPDEKMDPFLEKHDVHPEPNVRPNKEAE